MRSLGKSPWRLRSPDDPDGVFPFASGPLPPTTGRAVVQTKEARTHQMAQLQIQLFMNVDLNPFGFLKWAVGLALRPLHTSFGLAASQ